MKRKININTWILISALLASGYAEACYWEVANAKCYVSGQNVDLITWKDANSTQTYVVATGDWFPENGDNAIVTSGGTGTGKVTYTASTVRFCSGTAQYTDLSSHIQTLGYWENGIVDPGDFPVPSPHGLTGAVWGTTTGTTTCM